MRSLIVTFVSSSFAAGDGLMNKSSSFKAVALPPKTSSFSESSRSSFRRLFLLLLIVVAVAVSVVVVVIIISVVVSKRALNE